MTTPQTFLIVSLPHVEEEKIYKLEVEYVVLTVTLTAKEQTLLRTCVEAPFRYSDDTRGGGSELIIADYLVRSAKDVVWQKRTLTERLDEPFTLYEIADKSDLKQWWTDMPAHDVYLSAQIVRECVETGSVDTFSHLDHCKCIIEQRRTKKARGETGVLLSQFEKDVLELTEDDFYISVDDDTLSAIDEKEELEEGEIK